MGHVYLKPTDTEEDEFGEGFDPSVLDRDHLDKEKAREAVLKVHKKMADISNASLKRNADVLLSKIGRRKNILWPGEQRIPEGKFVLTY